MNLSAFKQHLQSAAQLHFSQANGQPVPPHFHVTEMGLTTKHFIDCGGTVREEKMASFQIWVASDVDHRLEPAKLLGIIDKAAPLLQHEDLEVEVEYQGETVGRYALDANEQGFVLLPKHTDCLAKETCGIPETAENRPMFQIFGESAAVCTPGGGCC